MAVKGDPVKNVRKVTTTRDGDKNWTTTELPESTSSAVTCHDANRCQVVTSGTRRNDDFHMGRFGATEPGEILVTDDFGESWSVTAKLNRYGLTGVVDGPAADERGTEPAAWAVGLGGTILSTVDLPPDEVTPSVEQIDATTVELSWPAVGTDGAGGHGPAQRYQVRQATSQIDNTAEFQAATALCELGDCFSGDLTEIGAPMTFTVSELDPGTTYHWAMRALDEGGTTGAIGTVSLSLPEVAPATVDDLTATATSDRQIELRFSATGSNGDRPPPAKEYVVKQARSPINDDEADFAAATALCDGTCTFEPSTVGDELSLLVGDLAADTTYHYAVKTRDDAGELSALSNAASATTLASQDPPPGETGDVGRVDDLGATAQSETAIRLDWSAVSDRDGRTVDDYVVVQSDQPIDDAADFDAASALCGGVCDQFDLAADAVGQQLTLTVDDLTPGTTYHYAIAPLDRDDQRGPISPSTSATTAGQPPTGSDQGPGPVGRVDDLGATAQSETAIRLDWSAVSDRDGRTVDDYVVVQSDQPIDDAADFDAASALCGGVCDQFDLAADAVGQQLTLTVDDLTPGTTYHYAIAPLDRDDQRGPISPSTSATTAGQPPTGGTGDDPSGSGDDGPGGSGDDGPGVSTDDPDQTSSGGHAVRISGSDRLATAIAASREAFDDGQAGAAVLARADVFADGLAGVPLATAKDGPLLLTGPGQLHQAVAAELQRVLNDGDRVFLLGGQAALAGQIERRVAELGFEPVRLAGANRFETAAAIAERGLGAPQTALIATGGNFADAVTAGAAAAKHDGGVLLSAGDQLPPASAAYLDRHASEQYAVGGPAAAAAPQATRLVGRTRYETAAAVAERFFTEPTTAGVATGVVFADALSGGAHIAVYDGPMLLSGPDRLHPAAANYLAGHASSIPSSVVYGGTAALGPGLVDAASTAISNDPTG
jgi:chitodextrinase